MGFVCPCRTCAHCRDVFDDPDWTHPIDGLAECPTCGRERWVGAGPYRDGRCPASNVELRVWHDYDDAILRDAQRARRAG